MLEVGRAVILGGGAGKWEGAVEAFKVWVMLF